MPRDWGQVSQVIRDCFESILVMAQPAWPLVIISPPGVGKTCAGLAMLDWYVGPDIKYYPERWVPVPGIYLTVTDLTDELIACQQHREGYASDGFWWAVRRASLIVLDELVPGREPVSEFTFRQVKELLDVRGRRPLVVLSNVDLDTVGRMYDDRVVSRLQSGAVMFVDGPDRRRSHGASDLV